jgi:hypothetical protein
MAPPEIDPATGSDPRQKAGSRVPAGSETARDLYQGTSGSPATVSVQGLTSAQASSVAAEVAAVYGGKAQVTSGAGGVLSVSVTLGTYYQR